MLDRITIPDHAQVSEIFNSIQGEGPYAGVRQVFIRFQGCQLHCEYCDTPQAHTDTCRIEGTPGKGDFYSASNPVGREDLAEAVRNLWSPSTRHVSLTGGEPLLHADFIKGLELEYPLYLETNSGLPEKARELKDAISIASCDIKLPEHGSTDDYAGLLEDELETISVLHGASETFIKVVILPETTVESISPAVEGIASIDRNIPFILQPVTYSEEFYRTGTARKVPPGLLLELMDFAGKKLKDVRAIPQTHKIMGLL